MHFLKKNYYRIILAEWRFEDTCIFRCKRVPLRPKVAEKGIWCLLFNMEWFMGKFPATLNIKH